MTLASNFASYIQQITIEAAIAKHQYLHCFTAVDKQMLVTKRVY